MIGAVVTVLSCGLVLWNVGNLELMGLGSSGVQNLTMTQSEPQLHGTLNVVPQFKSDMRALEREVEVLKAELNATQRTVIAAQADIDHRRLALGDPVPPITPEDLASEDSARRRLRNYFLAIPMMTAGLPKQQTVQMVSCVLSGSITSKNNTFDQSRSIVSCSMTTHLLATTTDFVSCHS